MEVSTDGGAAKIERISWLLFLKLILFISNDNYADYIHLCQIKRMAELTKRSFRCPSSTSTIPCQSHRLRYIILISWASSYEKEVLVLILLGVPFRPFCGTRVDGPEECLLIWPIEAVLGGPRVVGVNLCFITPFYSFCFGTEWGRLRVAE